MPKVKGVVRPKSVSVKKKHAVRLHFDINEQVPIAL